MRVRIEFEDSRIGVLSYNNLSSMTFICSIFKVFSMAHLVVTDFAKASFNMIKSGMPVNIVFVDDNGKEYINRMRVLSFSKAPDSRASFRDPVDMTLISSMYFDTSSGTFVHEGSIGTIFDNIMSRFFKGSVESYKGTVTNDLPARRYQTSERTLDFMKRILKYGMKDDFPVYLFHDDRGVLRLRGIKEMSMESPKFTAVPHMGAMPPETKSSSVTEPTVTMWDFVSQFDGRTACSEIETKLTSANFRFQKMVQSKYNFKSVENTTNQVQSKVPKKTRFMGWNLTPTDASAIAAKESFEDTCKTCSFKALFKGLDVENLNLGDTVNVKLPYDKSSTNSLGQASNLSEGRYLITDLEFTLNESVVQTMATMIQVAC